MNLARTVAWAPHWVMDLDTTLPEKFPSIGEYRDRLRSMSPIHPKEEAVLHWGLKLWVKVTKRLEVYRLIVLTMQA